MSYLLLAWIAICAVFLVFAIGGRRDGGALTLSYFMALSLIHVPGALAYIDPRYILSSEEETTLGFEMTLFGMVAFTAGAICVRMMSRQQVTTPNYLLPKHRAYLERLSYQMVVAGFVSYFIILPLAKFVPSFTAIISPLTALLILGFWLQLYLGIVLRDWRRVLGPILLLPVFPALTTITGGFIGFGVYWALSVVAFLFVTVRRRVWMIAAAPIVIYFGLSLFVTYMRDRVEIREVVWEEESPFGERIDRLARTITNFELLDLTNPNHLAALDVRLNQNYYVGMAMERYQEGVLDLQYGATVPIWALIPRAVWPDKPDVGGGRSVVKDVTGLDLSEGTSFGAGQVLEFYVNFGWLGVVGGFFGFGALFRWLDRMIVKSLNRLNVRTLLLCGMPGFVLLQPNGNLLEMLVSTVAALVVAYVLGMFLNRSHAKPRPQLQAAHL
jgi:hypothetical protein